MTEERLKEIEKTFEETATKSCMADLAELYIPDLIAEVRLLQARVSTLEKIDQVNCVKIETLEFILSKLDPAKILFLTEENQSMRQKFDEVYDSWQACLPVIGQLRELIRAMRVRGYPTGIEWLEFEKRIDASLDREVKS